MSFPTRKLIIKVKVCKCWLLSSVTTYRISDEKTALADTTVADEQHFEQVVMSIHLIIWSRHFLNNKLIIQKYRI